MGRKSPFKLDEKQHIQNLEMSNFWPLSVQFILENLSSATTWTQHNQLEEKLNEIHCITILYTSKYVEFRLILDRF